MILISACLIVGCAAATAPESNTLVIHSATIIDGRSGARMENATIIIEGNRITSIGDVSLSSLPSAAQIIDGNGKWVVPGFVDVHGHDASEPYLRTMLAWGVTSTQLMPNAPPASPVAMERASEAAQMRSPRLQVTKMFTGEFPDNLLPGVYQFRKPKSDSEAREAVQALHGNGYRQIKIIQDDSRLWTGADSLAPRLEKSVFDALVAEAHAHQMRVYVHAPQRMDTTMAIEAGIEAFMHGTMDTLLEVEQWQQMLAAGTVWTPAYHALYWFGDKRSYAQRVLGDPRLTVLLPEDQHEQLKTQAQADAPIVFDAMQTLVDQTEAYVSTMAKNTQGAQAAGVPIAVGSDGGLAGISTHLEMELLQENGLTASEALTAATYGGAVAMGRQRDIGSVETGKLADLIILNADPGVDVRNCREIDWVIKGGTAYKPQELVLSKPTGK
jgi:imidazolonepropionase-like amidohydrolase